MSDDDPTSPFRQLPSIHALLEDEALLSLIDLHGRQVVADAARQVVADARETLRRGGRASAGPQDVVRELERRMAPRLRRVVNATGVVLHTNLGRAPLARSALGKAVEATRGYSNLEVILESGERGGRDDGVRDHLRTLVGAEDAFAVNNCAAAALLALSGLSAGREVIVSRGELVEIGGGFRIPEVISQGGGRLVEVGTTNRTRPGDYEGAMSEKTGALLKVHRSNFAVVGFTAEASIVELAPLARSRQVPLVFDQGTGDLLLVRRALEDGADVVLFSGDKLLGGPQAGLVAGRSSFVEKMRRHPLARALRLDRLRLAALEETLALWRRARTDEIPAARMLTESAHSVRRRADALAGLLQPLPVNVVPCVSLPGGGTRPGAELDSFGVEWRLSNARQVAARLRKGEPAVVARVTDEALLLDARTIFEDEIPAVAAALAAAARDAEAEDTGSLFFETGEAP